MMVQFVSELQEAIQEAFLNEDGLSVPAFLNEAFVQGVSFQTTTAPNPDSRVAAIRATLSPPTSCCRVTNSHRETAANALTACTLTLRSQSIPELADGQSFRLSVADPTTPTEHLSATLESDRLLSTIRSQPALR